VPAASLAKCLRKSVLVLKLLTRAKGATIAELTESTGWQPHSARAHLSNLRKQGRSVVREQWKSGETAYRVVETASQAASTAVAPAAEADATNPVTA
jgi:predicted ArsR family transcriptional regulator